MELRARFERAMESCGPFEPRVHLAVAVSGGADSLSLLMLARDWASRRAGRVTALTVDHGLRVASTGEARAVGEFCASLGIEHDLLTWLGEKPCSAIQAKARDARYALLTGWCSRRGVLHLLVGHHADDQAETVALRRSRQSGPDGLAGMSMIVEHAACRVLRPLLAARKQELRAYLGAHGIAWFEDPSNRDMRFARANLRASGGPTPGDFSGCGQASRRTQRELATARLLAGAIAVRPDRAVLIDTRRLCTASRIDMFSAVERLATTLGARRYPPRRKRTDRVVDWLSGAGGPSTLTFAGCLWRRRGASVHVVAEGECRANRVEATAGGGVSRVTRALIDRGDSDLDGCPTWLQVNYGRVSAAAVSVPDFEVVFRPPRPLCGAAFAGWRPLRPIRGRASSDNEFATRCTGTASTASCERLVRP